jgi:hypothetical protein
MSCKELVETALRVLVAWNCAYQADPRDVEVLKAAFPSSSSLPVDELACQVIHDLSGRILPERELELKPPLRTMPPKKLAG